MKQECELFCPEVMNLEKQSKVLYLQELCNNYGDFKITTSIREDKDVIFWKHRSVLECWHSDKGLWYLAHATHRTSLCCEVILDLDENPSELKMDKICDGLEAEGYPYKAYFTGSKGYHIHVIMKELALLRKSEREMKRDNLIWLYGCDRMKKTDSAMIALEGCPHWKNGSVKRLLRKTGDEECLRV